MQQHIPRALTPPPPRRSYPFAICEGVPTLEETLSQIRLPKDPFENCESKTCQCKVWMYSYLCVAEWTNIPPEYLLFVPSYFFASIVRCLNLCSPLPTHQSHPSLFHSPYVEWVILKCRISNRISIDRHVHVIKNFMHIVLLFIYGLNFLKNLFFFIFFVILYVN